MREESGVRTHDSGLRTQANKGETVERLRVRLRPARVWVWSGNSGHRVILRTPTCARIVPGPGIKCEVIVIETTVTTTTSILHTQ
jgi:hypothetical protein